MPEHHLRVPVGCEEQSRQRFCEPLEGPLGAGGGLLDVHTVRRDAHQHVRPGARTELALPARQAGARSPGECLGQRGDHDLETVLDGVGLRHDPAEPRLRLLMIPSVGEQERCVRPDQEARALLSESFDTPHECVCVVAHGRTGRVAAGKVLGPHRRAVGRSPPKGGLVDDRRHAAPHDGIGKAGLVQQLGHLAHMAEHVGEVAHLHGAPERGRALEAELQIAHDRLAGDEEFVHEDVPGAEGDPSRSREAPKTALVLGTSLEVVVHSRHLAVEQIVRIRRVGLHEHEQLVHEVDETELEGPERRVPLAVPVRVGDDVDPAAGRAGAVASGDAPRSSVLAAMPCRLRLGNLAAGAGVVAGDRRQLGGELTAGEHVQKGADLLGAEQRARDVELADLLLPWQETKSVGQAAGSLATPMSPKPAAIEDATSRWAPQAVP